MTQVSNGQSDVSKHGPDVGGVVNCVYFSKVVELK